MKQVLKHNNKVIAEIKPITMKVSDPLKSLDIFVSRLNKINIQIKLSINYPWIYIRSINNKPVTETYQSEHGFVIGYAPIKLGEQFKITNIKEIFKLIRKYR